MNKTTVLIVEDEAIVATDLAGKLGQLGYQVVGTAGVGGEAVELACRLQPEVVLMDIRLKGTLDGIGAAEAIRRRYDVPVIYLTAHSDAATLERAKQSQPFGYILKPFQERELATTIEMALYKHQSERQLREQREMLRVTLASIGDAVITCDTAGRVTFLNPAAEALIGWRVEDARDLPIGEVLSLVDDQTRQTSEDPVALVLRHGRTENLANQTSLLSRDGREIPIENSAAPILDCEGRVIGAVLVFHDVTEKRQVQDALRRSNDELESCVTIRTHELNELNESLEERINERTAQLKSANENLRSSRIAALNLMEDAVIARKEAEETSKRLRLEIEERKRAEEALQLAKEAAEAANRAKSRFLANMSHELRTPMTGVLGMLDLALGGHLDAVQREYLEVAHKSARGLLHIINEILDLSTIESGKLSIEERPFNLGRCLADALGIFSTEARRKGLELISSVADDLPQSLVGDPLRLRQVLVNLIGNALKFTEQGQVELRVARGHRTPEGKLDLIFTITDTGIGIPDDKRHLLFQSFSQVDDSNTRAYGGSGLGLAICQEIVSRMGGTIGYESVPGEGSSFFFTVPFGEADGDCVADGEPAGIQAMADRTPDLAEAGKIRLLIAEDEPVIRQLLEVMLRLSNFDPEFAEDGHKAVEMWAAGNYDLILMDVQMPRMDGFSATRAIRERERERGRGHTLIVAMTAHAYREDENRCLAAGMDAFISKPIDLQKSIALINGLISQRNGEDRSISAVRPQSH